MRQLWHRLNGSSGSVLILVASIIFFIAAFTILAVDISKLLVTRAQLQNAADAGALAGAEMFLENPVPSQATIETRAEDLAKTNRAYNDSPTKPVDLVEQAEAHAFTDPTDARYGMVVCTTRAVVSQYFTALPGPMGQTSMAANVDRKGNVAALAAASAGGLCKVQCLKPWSIPDRHDDFSVPWAPWQGNGAWDGENFTDTNGNGIHDPGEPFADGTNLDSRLPNGPANGQYDSEFYHPFLTGYVAYKDLGLELTLKANNGSKPGPSQYYAIDLPIPDNNSTTGASRYRWNIANCNPTLMGPGDVVDTETGNMNGPTSQGMRDLINKDPGAYWDDGCMCVKSQYGDQSPRIVFIPLHDPRMSIAIPGKHTVTISKIAAFFIESLKSNGEVTGRFVRVQSPDGEICPPGEQGSGFVYTLTLIDPSQAHP